MFKRNIGKIAAVVFLLSWALLSHYAHSAETEFKPPTVTQKFEHHARCARLAFGASFKTLYEDHLAIAEAYATAIRKEGGAASIAYQIGFTDGNVDQIQSYTGGKYTRRAIAKSLYKKSCHSSM